MRKFLLACLFLLFTCYGAMFAQNKTLGIGVTAPNPNAALHVESPTANQGFIMPRLTTIQREAMTSLLSAADQGLMLYDSDLYSIFIWDGVAWESSSSFTIDDSTSANNGIQALTLGTGVAGQFTINNPSTFSHAVHAENNGDSTSAAIHGNHIGNGFGVFGKSAGSKFASAAVYGEHVGTGDAAGAFRISNSLNSFSALFGETNGSGPAVYGNQIGTGRGGQFQITNAANTNAAIRAFTSGTGYSGFYTINNTASTSPGIFTTTNGSGPAIVAQNTGAGNGFAGNFSVTNATNTFPAIQASTAGSGSGVRVMQTTGTGAGMDVYMQNTSSTAPGMTVDQNGMGNAGSFVITNATNGSPSVNAITNGTGAALEAKTSTGFTAVYGRHEGAGNGNAGLFEILGVTNAYPALQVNTAGTGYAINARHTGTSGDAVYAEHAGAANGSAGNFRVSHTANSASALFAATTGTNGTAIGASHEADGIAFAVWRGGIKVTVLDITTAVIPTRASAYRITGLETSFSLGFTPNDGEVFMIYNETGNPITFTASGISNTILANEGKTFIVFPGAAVRGF